MQRGCIYVGLALSGGVAHADDLLHEGQAVDIGARSDHSLITQLASDLAIFPFPGGPSVWGAPINATRVELTLATTTQGVGFEAGRAEFIRWPHLHVLGVERDTRAGCAFGTEVLGLYLPLWGDIGSREWSIFTIGADTGYRHQLTHAGARHAGDLGYTTATVELAIQHQVSDRTQLRSFAEGTYTLGVGKLEHVAGAAAEQLVELSAGLSLFYDLTDEPPVRHVPRTDPGTGEVTYTTLVNEGKRWRLIVLEISGAYRPFDSISTAPAVAMINTGLRHEY